MATISYGWHSHLPATGRKGGFPHSRLSQLSCLPLHRGLCRRRLLHNLYSSPTSSASTYSSLNVAKTLHTSDQEHLSPTTLGFSMLISVVDYNGKGPQRGRGRSGGEGGGYAPTASNLSYAAPFLLRDIPTLFPTTNQINRNCLFKSV